MHYCCIKFSNIFGGAQPSPRLHSYPFVPYSRFLHPPRGESVTDTFKMPYKSYSRAFLGKRPGAPLSHGIAPLKINPALSVPRQRTEVMF